MDLKSAAVVVLVLLALAVGGYFLFSGSRSGAVFGGGSGGESGTDGGVNGENGSQNTTQSGNQDTSTTVSADEPVLTAGPISPGSGLMTFVPVTTTPPPLQKRLVIFDTDETVDPATMFTAQNADEARSSMDAFCSASQSFDTSNCLDVKALVSVSRPDSIATLGQKYGFSEVPVYWWTPEAANRVAFSYTDFTQWFDLPLQKRFGEYITNADEFGNFDASAACVGAGGDGMGSTSETSVFAVSSLSTMTKQWRTAERACNYEGQTAHVLCSCLLEI